ncbi:MAG: hypothetical protein J1F14_08230 [Treponema sp.]|nr:hypothetical protein [Treponema sp.]
MLLKKLSKAAAVCAVMGMALAMVSCGDRNDGTYLTHEALEDDSLKLGGTWKLTGGYVYQAVKDSEEGMWYVKDEEGAPVAAQKVTDLDIVAGEFEYRVEWWVGDSLDFALHFDNRLCLTLTDAQAKEMLKVFLSYIEGLKGFFAEMREYYADTSDSFDGDVRGHVMLSADHTRIDIYVYACSEEKNMMEDGEERFHGIKDEYSFTLTRQ